MATEVMIPRLPCQSLDETLAFYVALGFTITHRQQAKPDSDGGVQWGGIELHFFTLPNYEPANSYSGCYVRVADVDALYQAFAARLQAAYGQLPLMGMPRLIPPKHKMGNWREFILVDPGGNWIRIGQEMAMPANTEAASKLSRAIQTANSLAEDKGNYVGAAQTLDAALWETAAAPAVQRIPALVARASLAITMHDWELGRRLLDSVHQLPLEAEERADLAADLQTAAALADMLPSV